MCVYVFCFILHIDEAIILGVYTKVPNNHVLVKIKNKQNKKKQKNPQKLLTHTHTHSYLRQLYIPKHSNLVCVCRVHICILANVLGYLSLSLSIILPLSFKGIFYCCLFFGSFTRIHSSSLTTSSAKNRSVSFVFCCNFV